MKPSCPPQGLRSLCPQAGKVLLSANSHRPSFRCAKAGSLGGSKRIETGVLAASTRAETLRRPVSSSSRGQAGEPGPRLYVPCLYVPLSLGPHRFEFGPRAARSGSDPREEHAGSLPPQTLVDANSNWTMGGLRPGVSVTVAHPWAPATETPALCARAGGAAHALRTFLACWVRGPFVPLPEPPAIRQSAPAPMERAAGGSPEPGAKRVGARDVLRTATRLRRKSKSRRVPAGPVARSAARSGREAGTCSARNRQKQVGGMVPVLRISVRFAARHSL